MALALNSTQWMWKRWATCFFIIFHTFSHLNSLPLPFSRRQYLFRRVLSFFVNHELFIGLIDNVANTTQVFRYGYISRQVPSSFSHRQLHPVYEGFVVVEKDKARPKAYILAMSVQLRRRSSSRRGVWRTEAKSTTTTAVCHIISVYSLVDLDGWSLDSDSRRSLNRLPSTPCVVVGASSFSVYSTSTAKYFPLIITMTLLGGVGWLVSLSLLQRDSCHIKSPDVSRVQRGY